MSISKALILAGLLVPTATLAAPADPLRDLRMEVAALQIDHALELTPQQAQAMLPILREARARADALKARREAALPAVEAALRQAIADLKASGTVSPATVQAMKAARGAAAGAARDEFKSFFQQTRAILTPAQAKAMKTLELGIAVDPTDPPDGAPGAGQAEAGPRPGMRFLKLVAVISEPFLALVQARAARAG